MGVTAGWVPKVAVLATLLLASALHACSGDSEQTAQGGSGSSSTGVTTGAGGAGGASSSSAATTSTVTSTTSTATSTTSTATSSTSSQGAGGAGGGGLGTPCRADVECAAGLKCCYPCGIPDCFNVCSEPDPGTGDCPLLP